ncbi:MAG: hypothetical protein QOD84_2761 [Acidobacteriaceae bacterium]|jgi:hypothetical protein
MQESRGMPAGGGAIPALRFSLCSGYLTASVSVPLLQNRKLTVIRWP